MSRQTIELGGQIIRIGIRSTQCRDPSLLPKRHCTQGGLDDDIIPGRPRRDGQSAQFMQYDFRKLQVEIGEI